MEEDKVIFREIQRFRSKVLWVFLTAVAGFTLYGVFQQVFLDIPFGNKPTSDTGLVMMFLIFGVGFPLFFYCLKLITEVRMDGIYYKFSPIHIRYHRIAFQDVKHYEIRKYRPLRECGGYGIRYGISGKVYNVSGVMGIQFEMNNGKKILIGTQQPNLFKDAIDKVK